MLNCYCYIEKFLMVKSFSDEEGFILGVELLMLYIKLEMFNVKSITHKLYQDSFVWVIFILNINIKEKNCGHDRGNVCVVVEATCNE